MKKQEKQSYCRIKVYLSKSEIRMLNKQAKGRGLSVAAYLRALIRGEEG